MSKFNRLDLRFGVAAYDDTDEPNFLAAFSALSEACIYANDLKLLYVQVEVWDFVEETTVYIYCQD